MSAVYLLTLRGWRRLLPESVPWLAANNKIEAADRILQQASKSHQVRLPVALIRRRQVSWHVRLSRSPCYSHVVRRAEYGPDREHSNDDRRIKYHFKIQPPRQPAKVKPSCDPNKHGRRQDCGCWLHIKYYRVTSTKWRQNDINLRAACLRPWSLGEDLLANRRLQTLNSVDLIGRKKSSEYLICLCFKTKEFLCSTMVVSVVQLWLYYRK